MAETQKEYEDVHDRFLNQLRKASGDGRKKRDSGSKPPWYEDEHEAQIFSHIAKWKKGELVDPDSGEHPLVHAAWRCLAIACIESGDVPGAANPPSVDEVVGILPYHIEYGDRKSVV